MGKALIEYKMADGQIVYVEATSSESDRVVRGPATDKVIEKATESFESAVARLKPVAQAVFDSLKGLTPAEVCLELGLKFSAETGVVIASADAESSIKVAIKWKPGN